MKKIQKIVSLLCVLCIMMAISVPVSATTEDVMPMALIHCESGDEVGRLIITTHDAEQIGYKTQNCSHGVVGGTDIKYLMEVVTDYSCTYCNYADTTVETYWTDWICQGN